MEDLLVIILQFLLEFIFNVLINLPLDLPSRNRRTPEKTENAVAGFLWFCMGCALAYCSLSIVAYTLIKLPFLRVANVVLAPVLAAFLSEAIATKHSRANWNIIPRNHFWRSFWFTVGFVAVRFAYAKRF